MLFIYKSMNNYKNKFFLTFLQFFEFMIYNIKTKKWEKKKKISDLKKLYNYKNNII